MTHQFDRAHWQREFMLAAFSGVLYGSSNTLVGHPMDTIKTKMQAQHEYVEKISFKNVVIDVWRH